MNYLLGQPLFVKKNNKAAIVTSFNKALKPIGRYLNHKGELFEETFFDYEVTPLRVKDEKSPTGYAIYYGKHTKNVKTSEELSLKISDEKLIALLEETQKLIVNE